MIEPEYVRMHRARFYRSVIQCNAASEIVADRLAVESANEVLQMLRALAT
jgi:hypothetical protein